MITTDGKVYIKRYLAGQAPTIASCIAFGIGGKAEAVGDTALQFEMDRSEVVLTSYDFVNDRVVFKSVLPDDLSGKIYEVALFSQIENPAAGNFSSKLLATFDSDSEFWGKDTDGSVGTYTTANARIGGDSLSLAPTVSTTLSYILNDILFDLSGNSGADRFVLAYNVSGTVPTSVVFRLRTDASNYFSFTQTSPAAGYRVDTFNKGNATVTGTPSWENITSIEVRVTSASGGVATVDFDGIRIEDTDTVNPEYVMVARELLGTPFVKEDGKVQEIEYNLGVTV